MASGNPEIIYGVQLLDDLHNYFPDLLYNNQRFTTVQGVLRYITSSTRRRFDLFSYGRSQYTNYNRSQHQETDTKDDNDEEETEDDEERDDDDEDEQPGNIQAVYQTLNVLPVGATPAPVPATTPATMPLTPPPQGRGASARGASPLPGARVQRSYASVLGGGVHGSTYRTQNLFSILPQFDSLIYSNLNMPSETNDQIDINMNLLSALAGLAPIGNQLPRSFLDPVPIFPTPAQVQAATTIRTLDADMEDNCSVCQDTMRSGESIRHITVCNHTFHRTCIDTWFVRNVRCPVCRHDIRETSVVPSTAAPVQQQMPENQTTNPQMDNVE